MKYKYYLNDNEIPDAEIVKDLGIKIGKSLKFTEHSQFSAKKADQILGLILKTSPPTVARYCKGASTPLQ